MDFSDELEDIRNYSIGREAIERYDDLCERSIKHIYELESSVV